MTLLKTTTVKTLQRSNTTKTITKNTTNKILQKYSGPSVTFTFGTEDVEITGSSMTGSDGDTSRTYTHTGSIRTNAKVFLGSSSQGLLRLPSTAWSLSTTTNTNDTITIVPEVYDSDVVIIDQ